MGQNPISNNPLPQQVFEERAAGGEHPVDTRRLQPAFRKRHYPLPNIVGSQQRRVERSLLRPEKIEQHPDVAAVALHRIGRIAPDALYVGEICFREVGHDKKD